MFLVARRRQASLITFGAKTGRSTKDNFGRYGRVKIHNVLFFPFPLFTPIMMTTLCAIMGVFPIALGWGQSGNASTPWGYQFNPSDVSPEAMLWRWQMKPQADQRIM
ncbi:hypothetical protein ACO0LM_01250 [Undibacterium sp. Di26W]|uniref:hypothetical protein n=1 Tax=Undibacterium sp. Di26W TaxID=3413035 RepID=UPI003BF05308